MEALSRHPRARDQSFINDGDPYCAVRTFHPYPAKVQLAKPKLCRSEHRYIY